jgi:iron uptake system EfeUOB component EfeO/EfeM
MSEAAKGKLSVSQVLAEADALRKRARPESSEKANAFIQTNVFAQIMLNQELSPEAKRDAMVSALTFEKDATKEQNRAKQQAFEEFKEYLQEQRKILNREGIKLQDTEAFAELQHYPR